MDLWLDHSVTMEESVKMGSAMPDMGPSLLPPSPPSRVSILFSKLRAVSIASFGKIGGFNAWIANKFNTSRKRVFQVEIGGLIAFGYTQMQISEWAAAVFCWFALGFILLIKALAWDGVRGQRGLTSLLRLAMSFGAVAVSVVLVMITVLHKPENEPWSNLQKLQKLFQFGSGDRHAVSPTPTQTDLRDSLPFILGAPLGDNDSSVWQMMVMPFGVLSSFDCGIKFSDLYRQTLKTSAHSIGEAEKNLHFSSTSTNDDSRFTWVPIDRDHQHYHVEINCRHGAYDEDWEVARVQGQLRTKITIDRLSPWSDQKPEKVYSCIDHVSARPSETTKFQLQDKYALANPDWKPNHVFEFPVVIRPLEGNPGHYVYVMGANNPGCWECLLGKCGERK